MKSRKQAIAIGLSKARKKGKKVPGKRPETSAPLLVKNRAYFGGELVERERLADQMNSRIQHAAMHDSVGGISGGEQHF